MSSNLAPAVIDVWVWQQRVRSLQLLISLTKKPDKNRYILLDILVCSSSSTNIVWYWYSFHVLLVSMKQSWIIKLISCWFSLWHSSLSAVFRAGSLSKNHFLIPSQPGWDYRNDLLTWFFSPLVPSLSILDLFTNFNYIRGKIAVH